MSHTAAQILGSVAFALLLAVAFIFAFGAYRSLRRLDDVLLKSRIYLNSHRLVAGFFSLAIGSAILMAAAAAGLVYLLGADASLPPESSFVLVAAWFASLLWSFYNFWALTRSPKSEAAIAKGGV